MSSGSKFALIVLAALVAMTLWWTFSTVKPVAASLADGTTKQTEKLAVASPAVDDLTASTARTPAIEPAAPAIPPPGEAPRNQPGPNASIKLLGAVVDSDGAPFSNPETSLALISSSGSRRVVKIETGQYSFDDLEPGKYVLQSRKPGFKHLDLEVVLRADEPVHRQDIRIERAWTITVHILTPEGEDLRTRLVKESLGLFLQPSILSTIEPPGDRLQPSLLLDRTHDGVSLGTEYLNPLNQGEDRDDRIFVQAEPPIYVSVLVRDRVLATQKVQDRVEELTFVLGVDRFRQLLSGLTVRLVNGESGMPAVDAGVSLMTNQSMESEVRPDEQGVVHISDHVPGLYEVHARLKGFAREIQTVSLEPGGITDLGTITFKKGIVVSGKCVDGEGNPRRVPAELIRLSKNPSSDQKPASFGYLLKMDDQGHFSVSNLPTGMYSVRVFSKPIGIGDEGETGWATAPLVVDARDGLVENLVIVVQRPVMTTLHPIATEVQGMHFKVMTTDGLEYHDGEFVDSAAIGLELVPGVYNVRLSRGQGLVREVPLTVGTSPVTVDVAP